MNQLDTDLERLLRKMEVEQRKEDEQERVAQLTLEEAVEGGLVVKGRVDRWFGDRGYGFVRVKGKSVFCRTEEGCGEEEYGKGGCGMGEGNEGLVEGGFLGG